MVVNQFDFDTLTLSEGAHNNRSAVCLLEAAAWMAGEEHSDHPECVSLVVAAFGRSWNDGLPDNETRDRLLKPLLPELLNTRTTEEDEETRAWMAADWLVRVHTPAWLRLAGLEEQADRLANLAPLDPTTTPKIQPVLEAVRKDADAARVAARDAAWDAAADAAWDAAWDAAADAARVAAWDAAWDAARVAAWDAAWVAAWDAARVAAWDAAWDAARVAAWVAARAALQPTVVELQESAVDLMRRMCAVGRS